jgi:polyisoprenoid-binding protein YceI
MKILSSLFFIFLLFQNVNNAFLTKNGKVYFKSDAPLELIEAVSTDLKGAIDTEKNTFAFTVSMNSFKGFNSPLQQEHFNENYLETKQFPNATFKGKIIETIDFTKEGTHTIRAKGTLNIHGVAQERIIKSNVTIKNGTLEVSSKFTVLLEEHNITIPKIVNQKIAKEIQVAINTNFQKKS